MAIVGIVETRRGAQVVTHTFTGLVSGDSVDQVSIGGWPEIITAYFAWPAGYVSGAAQLIIAHSAEYTGLWPLFGPVPVAGDDELHTIQVPGNGIEYLGVRVTTPVVTSPVDGSLTVHIFGR